jgi:hypothetical protein
MMKNHAVCALFFLSGFMDERKKKKNLRLFFFSFGELRSALNRGKCLSIMHVVPFTAETVLNIICAHSRHVDSSFHFALPSFSSLSERRETIKVSVSEADSGSLESC